MLAEVPRERRNAAVITERLINGVEVPSDSIQPIGQVPVQVRWTRPKTSMPSAKGLGKRKRVDSDTQRQPCKEHPAGSSGSDYYPLENEVASDRDTGSESGHTLSKRKMDAPRSRTLRKKKRTHLPPTATGGGKSWVGNGYDNSRFKKAEKLKGNTGPLEKFLSECPCLASPPASCRTTTFFNQSYDPRLKAMICTAHPVALILPMNRWVSHIKHHEWATSFPPGKDEAARLIANHISAAFDIDIRQSADDLDLPEMLSSPVRMDNLYRALTGSVMYRYRCTFVDDTGERCTVWRAANRGYRGAPETEIKRHLWVDHQVRQLPESFEGQWVQKIAIDGPAAVKENHYFTLPAHWSPEVSDSVQLPPPVPAFTLKSATAPPTATWPVALGWVKEMEKLSEYPFPQLKGLVALPSRSLSIRSKGRTGWIEAGLFALHREARLYLEGATEFLSGRTMAVGSLFSLGSKPRKSNYTQLSANYSAYHFPLVRTSSMLVRLVHARTKKKSVFSKFKWPGNHTQGRATIAMHDFFILAEGHPEKLPLRRLMHTLFDSLVRADGLGDDIIGCATDFMLLLYSLRSPELLCRASTLLTECCRLQFCFRSTLVHVARIFCHKLDGYVGLETSSDAGSNVSVADERNLLEINSDLSSDEEGYGVEGVETEKEDDDQDCDIDPSFMLFSARQGPMDGSYLRSQDSVMKFLADEKAWDDPTGDCGRTTPCNRLMSIWWRVNQHSQGELTGSHLKVEQRGNVIEIADPARASPAVEISLRSWSSAALEAIVEFSTAVKCLLPSNNSDAADSFPIDRVTDNNGRYALHRQPQNSQWMDTIRNTVRKSLFSPLDTLHGIWPLDGIDFAAGERWLVRDQVALSRLAAGFALSTGIGVTSRKYKNFRYDATDEENRNVWLATSGSVILADPLATYVVGEIVSNLFAFPPDMSQHVVFYFTILRPLACEILQLLGRHVPLYKSIIWAHTTRKPQNTSDPWRWSSPDVSEHVQRHSYKTLGVSLTPSIIHSILRALFKTNYPALFLKSSNSLVDKQSQHLSRTSLLHYGLLHLFPYLANVPQDQPIRNLAVSEIWQSYLGLGPANSGWCDAVAGTDFATGNVKYDLTLEDARHFILFSYDINTTLQTPNEIKLKVANCLKSLSHALTISESASEFLAFVIKRLFHHGKQPIPSFSMSAGWLSESMATDAITIVIHASMEWSSGNYEKLSGYNSEMLLRFHRITSVVMETIHEQVEWRKIERLVYLHDVSSPRPVLPTDFISSLSFATW